MLNALISMAVSRVLVIPAISETDCRATMLMSALTEATLAQKMLIV